jgi:F420-dependent oxidoreductase-like protein
MIGTWWVGSPASAAERPPLRFGIQTPQEDTTWEDLLATWKDAEQLGFDEAWVYDHFVPIIGDKDGPALEGWTLLAALAMETSHLRLGTLVTGNTYRNPAVLAKMATTVDIVSGGRLNFGIGAAWFELEHTAYGIPFYTAKERAERLSEALEVITKLWRTDHPSFAGKFYTLEKAPFAPKPVQRPHPPIVIGGKGKKWIMPLVARYADEWNVPTGVTPQGIKNRLAIVREECARIGRTPCDLEVSAFLPLVNITDIPLAGPATRLAARMLYGKRISTSVLAGSVDQIIARIHEYRNAGATKLIISLRPPFNRDLMRRFATEIMPRFREPLAGGPGEGKPAAKPSAGAH